MKTLELEKMGMATLTRTELEKINGGQNESEINFLMNANGWSYNEACEVLGLADKNACLSSNPCTNFN